MADDSDAPRGKAASALAAARDRPHRGGIDHPILDEAFVDVNRNHLAENQMPTPLDPVENRERDGSQPAAPSRLVKPPRAAA